GRSWVPRLLLQSRLDMGGDLRQREVAHVAAVAHQKILKVELALVALLEGDAQLDDVDRGEIEIGDEQRRRAGRRLEIEAPILDQVLDDRADRLQSGILDEPVHHATPAAASAAIAMTAGPSRTMSTLTAVPSKSTWARPNPASTKRTSKRSGLPPRPTPSRLAVASLAHQNRRSRSSSASPSSPCNDARSTRVSESASSSGRWIRPRSSRSTPTGQSVAATASDARSLCDSETCGASASTPHHQPSTSGAPFASCTTVMSDG